MRTIHLFIATSLDGFIAGPDGEIDWLSPFESVDYGYNTFLESIDTTLMGNTTYKEVLSFGDFPYKDKTNYVFTRNANLPEAPYITYVTEEAVSFVRALKQQDGKDIWLVGGGQLNSTLLAAELIDKISLFLIPITIGRGIPLFAPSTGRLNWMLQSSKALDKGMMQLEYVKPTGELGQ
jgi:dihydrofolate reductase